MLSSKFVDSSYTEGLSPVSVELRSLDTEPKTSHLAPFSCSIQLAKLPDDIIREIAQYTGLKNRNGKYMVQIPKNDPRYSILEQIPSKKIFSESKHEPHFMVCVTLTREYNPDYYIHFHVSPFLCGIKNYVNYNLYVIDKKNISNRRNYHYQI